MIQITWLEALTFSTVESRIRWMGLVMRGLDRICKALAMIFMPQMSSAYAFLALSFASGLANTLLYLLISILFAALIEVGSLLLFIWILRKDANVEAREDRPALFTIAIFSYVVGFVLLRYLEAPFIFTALMFAYVTNTIVAATITRYLTKVSIHTWGITGPSVAILYSFGALGFVLWLAVGVLVGATRIRLGFHSRVQVALSFLVSVPLTWFILYVVPLILPTVFRPQ